MAVIGTFGSFTAARLGIYASQSALNLTGNNIANINTAGYTRQRLDLVSLYSYGTVRYANGFDLHMGYGVLADSVSQLRDPFLDIRFRDENSNSGAYAAKLDCLQELSHILDEVGKGDGEFGIIAGQLEDFLMQLQNYNGKVGSEEYDTTARGSAQTLTRLFRDYAEAMDTLGINKLNKLKEDIGTVNTLLTEIRDLSAQIREGEIYGDNCLEMRDARNLRIDELSSYIKISVTYDKEKIDEFKSVERINISIADTKPPIKLIQGIYGAQISMPETAAKRNPFFNANDPASNYYISRESNFSDPSNPYIVYTNNKREAYTVNGKPLVNTREALEEFLGQEISDKLEARLRAAHEAAVRDQLEAAEGAKLKEQVTDALREQLEAKLRTQLEKKQGAKLKAELREALKEELGTANPDATDEDLEKMLKEQKWLDELDDRLRKKLDDLMTEPEQVAAVDNMLKEPAQQKKLEQMYQEELDKVMADPDSKWHKEVDDLVQKDMKAQLPGMIDDLKETLDKKKPASSDYDAAKAPYLKTVQAKDEDGNLIFDDDNNPVMIEVGTWDANEADQVQNATEEDWENNNLWMSVDPLVDNKGRYLRDQYHKEMKESVDLTDVQLYGSIQSLREFLTEKGEFSSDDDLKFDSDAAQKRGIQYYRYALDALARKFADSFNRANQLNMKDVSAAYKFGEIEDPNDSTKTIKVFIGKDGKPIKDKNGDPITLSYFDDLAAEMAELEALKNQLVGGKLTDEDIAAKKEELAKLRAQVGTDNATLADILKERNDKIADLNTQIADAQVAGDTELEARLIAERDALDAMGKLTPEEIAAKEEELTALKTKRDSVVADIADLQKQIDKLNALDDDSLTVLEKKRKDDQLTELGEELTSAETKRDNLDNQIKDLTDRLDPAKGNNMLTQDEIDAKNARIEVLKGQIEEGTTGKLTPEDIADKNARIAELENSIAEKTPIAYDNMERLRNEGTLTELWSFYNGGVLFSNNGDLNDPTGITAKNITISKDWTSGDVRILHTKIADGIDHSTSDDNILHMIAMMSEDMNYLPNEIKADAMDGGTKRYFHGSFAERLADMNSILGVDTDTTGLLYNNYTTQTLSLENSRLSVSSVDLNDEATSMMMFQKSYAAACQLMTTLDSMLDKLINGTLR